MDASRPVHAERLAGRAKNRSQILLFRQPPRYCLTCRIPLRRAEHNVCVSCSTWAQVGEFIGAAHALIQRLPR